MSASPAGLSRGTGMNVTDSMQLLADGLAGVATVLDEFGSGQSERPMPRSDEDISGLVLPEASARAASSRRSWSSTTTASARR